MSDLVPGNWGGCSGLGLSGLWSLLPIIAEKWLTRQNTVENGDEPMRKRHPPRLKRTGIPTRAAKKSHKNQIFTKGPLKNLVNN
jgi:hypothetical protein